MKQITSRTKHRLPQCNINTRRKRPRKILYKPTVAFSSGTISISFNAMRTMKTITLRGSRGKFDQIFRLGLAVCHFFLNSLIFHFVNVENCFCRFFQTGIDEITQPQRNDRYFVEAGWEKSMRIVRKNLQDWVSLSRLGYLVNAGRKKICKSNFKSTGS